ncbi:galactose oxidase/kelch repeat superfamily protein [Carex rostrata]
MRRVRVSSLQAPVHKLGDSQMKLTPKFRFGTVALSPTISATADPNTLPEPPVQLIPGLPDDVALNCLLRLPVKSHLSCRLVCRQWHNLFSSKSHFFTLRKTLKLQSPYLFTLAYHRCTGKIEWRVFDLTHLSWHSIPAMPCRDHACPRGFGCVSLPKIGSLLVCGGLVSDMDCPLHLVLKYDVCKNKWTVLPPMLSARSFFGGGVIGGRVYVAGGYSTNQFELNSTEVYDPVKGMWDPVAGMGIHMAASDSAVIDGKLYVTEGCAWPFFSSPRGRIYDPKPNKWESMATGMREGWTGLGAVYDNRLFVISEYERMRVKVYDMESDMWDPVDGPPLPERVKKPFSVSCLERQGRIVVVGRGLHIAIGHVERCFDFSKSSCNKPFRKVNYAIRWEEVEAPHEFSDLTPSSCQILYA